MKNKKTLSPHQEVELIEIFKFIIQNKLIILLSVILSFLFGLFYIYSKKNIYRTEIPVVFNFTEAPYQFDVELTTKILKQIFLEKKFNDIFFSSLKELNQKKADLISVDITYHRPFVSIIIESNSNIDTASLKYFIASINNSITEYNRNYILNLSNSNQYFLLNSDNYSKFNTLISYNLLQIESAMDFEIYTIAKNIGKDKDKLFFELKTDTIIERQKLFIKTQLFTKMISLLKINGYNPNIENLITKFSDLQKKYEYLISLKESLSYVKVYPTVNILDQKVLKFNEVKKIYVASLLTVFIILGVILSILFKIFFIFLKNFKNNLRNS